MAGLEADVRAGIEQHPHLFDSSGIRRRTERRLFEVLAHRIDVGTLRDEETHDLGARMVLRAARINGVCNRN